MWGWPPRRRLQRQNWPRWTPRSANWTAPPTTRRRAAIFFTMFVVGTGLLSLLEERKRRTLARLLSTPLSPGRILDAKFLLSFVVGIGSVGVFMVVSRFLLGAKWVDPPITALLVVAAVGAATGIVSLVAGLARTAGTGTELPVGGIGDHGHPGRNLFPGGGRQRLLERSFSDYSSRLVHARVGRPERGRRSGKWWRSRCWC